MAARTVLEELTEEDALSPEYVGQRLDDWAARVEALYGEIERWLPAGWTARRGSAVTMHEELMQKSNVPARKLPTLEIVHDAKVQIQIRPYGLWIIGANGRLDLIAQGELFFLLDHAKTFERPSWQITPAKSPRSFKPFDEKQLRNLLRA